MAQRAAMLELAREIAIRLWVTGGVHGPGPAGFLGLAYLIPCL